MGYWEQIGVANRRHQERRAGMDPRRRWIQDAVSKTAMIVAAVAIWAIILGPVLIPLFR